MVTVKVLTDDGFFEVQNSSSSSPSFSSSFSVSTAAGLESFDGSPFEEVTVLEHVPDPDSSTTASRRNSHSHSRNSDTDSSSSNSSSRSRSSSGNNGSQIYPGYVHSGVEEGTAYNLAVYDPHAVNIHANMTPLQQPHPSQLTFQDSSPEHSRQGVSFPEIFSHRSTPVYQIQPFSTLYGSYGSNLNCDPNFSSLQGYNSNCGGSNSTGATSFAGNDFSEFSFPPFKQPARGPASPVKIKRRASTSERLSCSPKSHPASSPSLSGLSTETPSPSSFASPHSPPLSPLQFQQQQQTADLLSMVNFTLPFSAPLTTLNPLAIQKELHRQHQKVFTHKPQKRKCKRMPHVSIDRVCFSCGIGSTPEWRKGPFGPKTLCNACGLQFAKDLKESADITDEPPAKTKRRASSASLASLSKKSATQGVPCSASKSHDNLHHPDDEDEDDQNDPKASFE